MAYLSTNENKVVKDLCQAYPKEASFDRGWEKGHGITPDEMTTIMDKFEDNGWIEKHPTMRGGDGMDYTAKLTTTGHEELCESV